MTNKIEKAFDLADLWLRSFFWCAAVLREAALLWMVVIVAFVAIRGYKRDAEAAKQLIGVLQSQLEECRKGASKPCGVSGYMALPCSEDSKEGGKNGH